MEGLKPIHSLVRRDVSEEAAKIVAANYLHSPVVVAQQVGVASLKAFNKSTVHMCGET